MLKLSCRLLGILLVTLGPAAFAAPASAERPLAPPGAQGHPYRKGVVPLRGHQAVNAATPAGANSLSYGGGIGGIGVTTGHPHVYLVIWGSASQWGTPSYNSNGTVASLSHDPQGMVPYLERFIEGLGTGSDAKVAGASTWSGVMTQYCQGSSTVGVAIGAQLCPAGALHVGYPVSAADGGALQGVWVDQSSAAPAQASGYQIGQEAVAAASHFGNTTQSANRSAQYVIVSPTGTHPDGFNTPTGQFCAWHDYTGDRQLPGGAVSSSVGQLAFTNLPYIPDAGVSCGQAFVNPGSAGALDGVSIVEGHEYAETITDQLPAGGWLDSSLNENGDKCAWISTGTGRSQDISLGTGTFAVQSTWANDAASGSGGCEISHPIVSNATGNKVTITSPSGSETGIVGSAASVQVAASDSGGAAITSYSASGLPPGLTINASTGLISGTPTTPGSSLVQIIATDATGASGGETITWTVTDASGTCTAGQLLGNPGLETGTATPWSATSNVVQLADSIEPAHSGHYLAWLDGYGTPHTDRLTQTVTLPSSCTTYTLSLWRHIDTSEDQLAVYDRLRVQVLNTSGTVLGTLAVLSNLNAAAGYVKQSYSLAAYAGQTVQVRFLGTETDSGGGTTNFIIDDAALNVS